MPAPLAAVLTLLFCCILACYPAAIGYAYHALGTRSVMATLVVLPALWTLADWVRGWLFTGFPWGQGGYAQLDGPFADLAKIVGVHGLTFAATLLAAGVAGQIARPSRLGAAVTAAALLSAAALGFALKAGAGASAFSNPVASPFTVTLLQGNIAQDEKFRPSGGIPDALKWYQSQLLAATTSLVVTPETAIPLLPNQLPAGYLDALVNRFMKPSSGEAQTAALVGIPLGNSQQGYTNSVIALKPSSSNAVYQYDKHHLVPFGEFVHPLFKWFLSIVNIPLADFNSGAVSQPSLDWQGQRIAPNICYEDLFGEELAARFIDPSTAPTLMVNISNIGWFGNTIAIDQHLNISRMRAIEFERPMVRATNTGATAIIDHTGRVTHLLPRHTRGALTGSVEGRSGITPYAWWAARFGLWPWWALIAAIVLIATRVRFHWAKARFDR
jgi:apolipoprotein N-acyltransferase